MHKLRERMGLVWHGIGRSKKLGLLTPDIQISLSLGSQRQRPLKCCLRIDASQECTKKLLNDRDIA